MRLTLAITTALLLTGCDFGDFESFQAHFEHRYDLQPGARLNLQNVNGSVEIEGWDQNAIEIRGERFASSQQLLDGVRTDIHHAPDSADIRTIVPSGRFGGMGARYTIRVPRKTNVDRIVTSNGSIQIRDIATDSKSLTSVLRTSNASITATNIQGAVDAQTSNGRIELNRITGEVSANSSNGRINIELDQPAAAPLRATTSNGPIELILQTPPTDVIRARTRNGSITLRLPGATGAHLMADTSNSQVSTDFDVHEHDRSANRIDGIIGAGGPEIELSTRNGHVSILKTP